MLMWGEGTYTGHYEPVKEMSDLLDEYEKQTGNYVPIHGEPLRPNRNYPTERSRYVS
jgi:hypothetical protein